MVKNTEIPSFSLFSKDQLYLIFHANASIKLNFVDKVAGLTQTLRDRCSLMMQCGRASFNTTLVGNHKNKLSLFGITMSHGATLVQDAMQMLLSCLFCYFLCYLLDRTQSNRGNNICWQATLCHGNNLERKIIKQSKIVLVIQWQSKLQYFSFPLDKACC